MCVLVHCVWLISFFWYTNRNIYVLVCKDEETSQAKHANQHTNWPYQLEIELKGVWNLLSVFVYRGWYDIFSSISLNNVFCCLDKNLKSEQLSCIAVTESLWLVPHYGLNGLVYHLCSFIENTHIMFVALFIAFLFQCLSKYWQGCIWAYGKAANAT